MDNYTIESFWKPRLRVSRPKNVTALAGWQEHIDPLPTFTEAPLSVSDAFAAISEGLMDVSVPDECEILLISAPGAVGKSTLARQISALTSAIYVDLSTADAVGANTLSGGLVKFSIYEDWKAERTAILLDGLDEARLKITQVAFEAFLTDVADVSRGRRFPTVIFGRTGAIVEAGFALAGKAKFAVLEIGYYPSETAIEFALSYLNSLTPDSPHRAPARRALELLLEKLRSDTENSGDQFAGYAPVLRAVSDHVARTSNPGALVALLEKGEQPITLDSIVNEILDREQGKLQSIDLESPALKKSLYGREEQLARIAALMFGLAPPELPKMSARDAQVYNEALVSWVPEHPFLNGQRSPSSAVFEGYVNAWGLRHSDIADSVLQQELKRGGSANPFLAEFYLVNDEDKFLPAQFIGIIYNSIRARLSLGDTASLAVEGPDDADDVDGLVAEVEISLSRYGQDGQRLLKFSTEQTAPIRMGAQLADVEIFAPYSTVEIGSGIETVLIAPISIQCSKLLLNATTLIIEAATQLPDAAVYLEAEQAESGTLSTQPVLHGDVNFNVAWPGARAHPWTSFATTPVAVVDPRLDEGLRRFRRFVVAFRSHSKGSLKRFKDKIEHARMTKGVGQAVLNLLLEEGVLSVDGEMYTLHPIQLSLKAGTSYADAMARKFSDRAVAFVSSALSRT